MSRTRTRAGLVLGGAVVVAVLQGGAASAAPTCSTTLGIAVHGQHIIGDYVTGAGRQTLTWPPAGQVGGGGGAAVPGGSAAGGHFEAGVAPGASFCLEQSQSPGAHPGGG